MKRGTPECLAEVVHVPGEIVAAALATLDTETRFELAQAARVWWSHAEPGLAQTILANLDAGTLARADAASSWRVNGAGHAHHVFFRAILAGCARAIDPSA